jgi:hypothetical protein
MGKGTRINGGSDVVQSSLFGQIPSVSVGDVMFCVFKM